jgi:hypothetical protein
MENSNQIRALLCQKAECLARAARAPRCVRWEFNLAIELLDAQIDVLRTRLVRQARSVRVLRVVAVG